MRKYLVVTVVAWLAVVVACAADLPLPPPKHGGVYVVAHRGAHQGIPENTLAAYQKAIDLGADFVEIDVRTTKDGKFVSCHNDSIDSYAPGHTGKVADMTLDELRALDIGSRIGPEWKGTKIPTFDEILDLCAGKIGIYLDLKNAPVEPLAKAIMAHDMEHNVIWYADVDELKRMKETCPECVEMPDPGPEKFLAKLIEVAKPRVIASVWRYYSPSFVKTCHDAGAIVIVDESDPSCWKDAIAWGSDGIQTNYPEKLIQYLDNGGGGEQK